MKKILITLIICLMIVPVTYGQIIKKKELIRLGFGVSTMANSNINSLIDDVEEAGALIGPDLNVTRFKDHITFFAEYENEISENWSYVFRFQYHSDDASGSNYDQFEKIEQGMNYEFYIYEIGFDLIYYLPIMKIGETQTSLILAAGPDLSYVEIEAYYFFDQRPVYLQTIDSKRNSMLFGASFFTGINIPFVESLNFQLRFGYSLRPEKEMPGEVKEEVYDNSDKGESAMDPAIFELNNRFDFSQYWATFSIAYKF